MYLKPVNTTKWTDAIELEPKASFGLAEGGSECEEDKRKLLKKVYLSTEKNFAFHLDSVSNNEFASKSSSFGN